MLHKLIQRLSGPSRRPAVTPAPATQPDPAAAETWTGMAPGDAHYRAYVGPVDRFGPVSLLQMGLMTALGLTENDRVLDFGCGSLRLGRLLIPFLRPGLYYGIDPNLWLVDEGFGQEAGHDLRTLKAPVFSGDDRFNCDVFGTTFDFIMAQSIITHSGADNTARFLASAAAALEDDGIIMLSYFRNLDDDSLPGEPWTYPGCVSYPPAWLHAQCRQHGLIWRDIDWYHPGAAWAVIAKDERRLPPAGAPLGVNGHPQPRWVAER